MGEMRNACNILVGKLGRPRLWSEDNIRMDLAELGWEGVKWIHLAQDRDQWRAFVNTVIRLPVPQKAEDFLISWVAIGFSKRNMLHGIS